MNCSHLCPVSKRLCSSAARLARPASVRSRSKWSTHTTRDPLCMSWPFARSPSALKTFCSSQHVERPSQLPSSRMRTGLPLKTRCLRCGRTKLCSKRSNIRFSTIRQSDYSLGLDFSEPYCSTANHRRIAILPTHQNTQTKTSTHNQTLHPSAEQFTCHTEHLQSHTPGPVIGVSLALLHLDAEN